VRLAIFLFAPVVTLVFMLGWWVGTIGAGLPANPQRAPMVVDSVAADAPPTAPRPVPEPPVSASATTPPTIAASTPAAPAVPQPATSTVLPTSEITGSLDVIVRDGDGKPVSGARVHVVADGTPTRPVVRPLSAVTDAQGRAQFSDVPCAARLRVAAVAAGRWIDPKNVELDRLRTGRHRVVALTAAAVSRVRLDIGYDSGHVVRRAWITRHPSTAVLWTQDQPELELPVGMSRLHVVDSDRPEDVTIDAFIPPQIGDDPVEIAAVLTWRSLVRTDFTIRSAHPIRPAVTIEAVDPDDGSLTPVDVLRHFEPGRYVVRASAAGHELLHAGVTLHADADTVLRDTLTIPDEWWTTLEFLGPDGGRIVPALEEVWISWDDRQTASYAADGRIHVLRPPIDHPGPHEIAVNHHAGLGAIQTRVDPHAAAPMVVRFAEPHQTICVLRGQMPDEHMWLKLRLVEKVELDSERHWFGAESRRVDHTGRFHFPPTESDGRLLRVELTWDPPGSDEEVIVASAPFAARSGTTEVEMAIPPLYRLVVRLPDWWSRSDDAWVERIGDAQSRRSAPIYRGAAHFPRLQPGAWRVTLPDDDVAVDIVINADAELTIDLPDGTG
jgi:hypothetical protein